MEELALPLICHMAAWGGKMPSPSMSEAGGRVGPEVIRAGKLPLPPTSYSPWEEWLLHLAWAAQYSWPWSYRCGRADPEDVKAGELALPLLISERSELARAMRESPPW